MNNIVLNELSLIVPELLLIIGALLTLLCGAFFKNKKSEATGILSIIIVACSLVVLFAQALSFYISEPFDVTIFYGSIIVDRFGIYLKFLILISGISVLFLLFPSKVALEESKVYEIPVLMLLSLCGMMFMVSASSLISLYMSMEMMSLPLYILAASRRNSSLSSESGLKYFILGSLSSGLYLFGASLVYGFTGEVLWLEIFNKIDNVLDPALLFGIMFIIISLCFKISAAPFHMWAPDVYQGAPTIVTTLFASAPKVAGIGLICRMLFDCFYGAANQWQQVIIAIAILSMFVGSLGAIMQKSFKRLLAYSSIGHVGFVLCGVATTEEQGLIGVLLYISIYITMTIGTFACLMSLKVAGKSLDRLQDLKGLSKMHPFESAALAIMMFSMAGIPPLAGFCSKWFILTPLIASQLFGTAILFVFASVIATYYYLKIVKYMYFDDQAVEVNLINALAFKIIITFYTLFNLLFLLFPSYILNVASLAVEMFIRAT